MERSIFAVNKFHKKIIFVFLLLLGHQAHSSLFTPTEEDSWYTQIVQETISPITTQARYVFLGGTAITTGFFVNYKLTDNDYLQEEYGEDKPQGQFSKIGDLAGQLIPNAAYAVGMYAFGKFASDEKAVHRAWYMVRATAYPALMSTLLKVSFEEKRPSGGKYSFPSGHTTTAFAFATAVACEHEWYLSVPAFSLAIFVGVSRMNDNKHYFHDVLAGATIGASYALGLHLLDKERSSKSEEKTEVSFYPVYNDLLTGLGLHLIY